MLKVSGLVKQYRGRRVVDGLSLEVNGSEIVGLLGPNGAGKTTSFYMIVGLVAPDKGKVFFQNMDITRLPMHKRAQLGIGYLSQEPAIFRNMTVEENIMAILEILDIHPGERKLRLQMLLEELRISHLAKNKAYTLSGGERRRLEITRALAISPSFLLLDEPFSGIDPIAVAECQEVIMELRERGIGILLTDHNVRETLSITDRAYLISEGKILLSGSAQELIEDEEARRVYLGEKFRM
ncbi:MAG: LPS export ABC transporter ATP-binding protein [Candidatus Omnitrophota bacterium]|nr:LPS export ABC transporter ATP-binding protein [Candidatus Omnitrophota bacterium]RKY37764.1 MAG: LPS export ABC transporter ATP-binding protein [Candidatus Omnitrophota bacterium]